MNRFSSEIATMPWTAENSVRARTSKADLSSSGRSTASGATRFWISTACFSRYHSGASRAGLHTVLEQRRPQRAIVARKGQVGAGQRLEL